MEVEATVDVGCRVAQNTRVLSMSFDCESLVIAQSTGSQSDLALNIWLAQSRSGGRGHWTLDLMRASLIATMMQRWWSVHAAYMERAGNVHGLCIERKIFS